MMGRYSGKDNFPFFLVGLLFVEERDVSYHAGDLASRATNELVDEFPFLILKFVESDFDQLVVLQGFRDGPYEHVGDTLLADDDKGIEMVAHLAEILALGTIEFNHDCFR